MNDTFVSTEPFVGFRVWTVFPPGVKIHGKRTHEPRLGPVTGPDHVFYGPVTWTRGYLGSVVPWYAPGAQEAICLIGKTVGTRHLIMGEECKCGFWALRNPNDESYHIARLLGEYYVVGEVELWGRVVEGEMGFRGQFARVRSLFERSGMAPWEVESLSKTYDVPIVNDPRWDPLLIKPPLVPGINWEVEK